MLRKALLMALFGTALLGADGAGTDVAAVLDKFRSARPADQDLAIFQLDWAPTLKDAKERAAMEKRPILLIVVNNSYGNMYTGHC